MQSNWIGKSTGAEFEFRLVDNAKVQAAGNRQTIGKLMWACMCMLQFTDPIRIFTSRPDTLFGVQYIAIAPEHPLASRE